VYIFDSEQAGCIESCYGCYNHILILCHAMLLLLCPVRYSFAPAEISTGLLDVYVTVLAKESVPGTPPDAVQPSSPAADSSHLQLQENRIRYVTQQQQQQQRQRSGGPTTPSEQQQQGEQQQPNGSLQPYPS
jgi:hypothetical protein